MFAAAGNSKSEAMNSATFGGVMNCPSCDLRWRSIAGLRRGGVSGSSSRKTASSVCDVGLLEKSAMMERERNTRSGGETSPHSHLNTVSSGSPNSLATSGTSKPHRCRSCEKSVVTLNRAFQNSSASLAIDQMKNKTPPDEPQDNVAPRCRNLWQSPDFPTSHEDVCLAAALSYPRSSPPPASADANFPLPCAHGRISRISPPRRAVGFWCHLSVTLRAR